MIRRVSTWIIGQDPATRLNGCAALHAYEAPSFFVVPAYTGDYVPVIHQLERFLVVLPSLPSVCRGTARSSRQSPKQSLHVSPCLRKRCCHYLSLHNDGRIHREWERTLS